MKKLLFIALLLSTSLGFTQISPQEEDPVFLTVEQMPEFPGGGRVLKKFLSDSLRFPSQAKEADIAGCVYVSCVVGKDSSLRDITVTKGLGYGCDEEAVRLVKSMPKWIPGRHKQKSVSVRYSLVVKFYKYVPREPSQEAMFPGGEEALEKYITEHFQYPTEAQQAKLEGSITVFCFIDRTGKIQEASILSNHRLRPKSQKDWEALDLMTSYLPLLGVSSQQEAIRVVTSMPDWIPAQKEGKNVHSFKTIDIPVYKFYPTVDKAPQFPGGQQELDKYLVEKLNYPAQALEAGVQGTVQVSFIVASTEGKITEVKVLKGIGYGCDEAAVRLVEQMPNWTPARYQGKKAAVRHSLPVIFKLPASK